MAFSYQPSGPSIVAVATGVIGSAWASGSIAAITIVGVPGALTVQQSAAQAWRTMFAHGKAVMPPIAISVALSYAYAAYEAHGRGASWKGYVTAAGLAVAIIPFTLIFMNSTNESLLGAASVTAVLSQSRVSELIKKWALLNLTRSVLPLASAAVGLSTFLSNLA